MTKIEKHFLLTTDKNTYKNNFLTVKKKILDFRGFLKKIHNNEIPVICSSFNILEISWLLRGNMLIFPILVDKDEDDVERRYIEDIVPIEGRGLVEGTGT